MVDALAHPRQVLTEEDLALLSHPVLADEAPEAHDEHASAAPPGFRERLVLGDLSW